MSVFAGSLNPRALRIWKRPSLVVIGYTNWRGERSARSITPRRIEWGRNDWHPEPQWLLIAWDMDKEAERSFAVKDIRAWHPIGDADEPFAIDGGCPQKDGFDAR